MTRLNEQELRGEMIRIILDKVVYMLLYVIGLALLSVGIFFTAESYFKLFSIPFAILSIFMALAIKEDIKFINENK